MKDLTGKPGRQRLLALLLCAASAVATAAQPLPPSPAYRGALELPGGNEIPLEVEFFTDAAGALGANLVSPAQGARYVPVVETTFDGRALAVRAASPPIEIRGELDDSGRWQAAFRQGGFETALVLAPAQTVSDMTQPQSAAALASWPGKEIVIATDGARLAGTHVAPEGEAPAAVLLLPGSGAAHRDGYHGGHRPLAVLAAALADAGVASLRYDKRGVYKSSGEIDIADLDGLTRDARAALARLRSLHPGRPIGVVGHSEGGVIAVALAAEDAGLSFAVSLAGPTMPLAELFALQDFTEARAAGASEAEARRFAAFSRGIYTVAAAHDSAEARQPALEAAFAEADPQALELFGTYNGGTGTLGPAMLGSDHFDELLAVDPSADLRQLGVPTLLLFGGLDVQVPAAENVAAAPSNPALEVRVLEGINHMLQPATSGAVDEYASIETSVAPEVLDAVTAFAGRFR